MKNNVIATASLDEMGADAVANFILEQGEERSAEMEAFVEMFGPNGELVEAIELHDDGSGGHFYRIRYAAERA